jgi:succinate-semialdehyde dehydrogenase/glutarate-semialdehyde dehydrogenase
MTDLHDRGLLRTNGLIDGRWVPADGGATFDVTDPSDGTVLASVAAMGQAETAAAITAADRAFPGWRTRTAKQRAAVLKTWHALLMEHADDLALLVTREMGKPIAEARGEASYGAGFVEWFAEEGKRAYGEIVPTHDPGERLLVLPQPVGVVAAITPWNFPLAMITRKVAPALAAGCTVVVKPAEEAPLTALAAAELARRAGMPGVLNVVPAADPQPVGADMTSNPTVRKLSFTGSVAVGSKLLEAAAGTVKNVSLELGGNAPFIVFDDADVDAAVEGAIISKYRNSGQTCICANRLLVQDGVYDEFAKKLADAVTTLEIGPPTDDATAIGPLVSHAALAKVEALVADAVDRGAGALTGGRPHALGGRSTRSPF